MQSYVCTTHEQQLLGRHDQQLLGGHEQQLLGRHEQQLLGRHEQQLLGRHEQQLLGRHEQQLFGSYTYIHAAVTLPILSQKKRKAFQYIPIFCLKVKGVLTAECHPQRGWGLGRECYCER